VELDGEHPSRVRPLDPNDARIDEDQEGWSFEPDLSRSCSCRATGSSATILAPPAEMFTVLAENGAPPLRGCTSTPKWAETRRNFLRSSYNVCSVDRRAAS